MEGFGFMEEHKSSKNMGNMLDDCNEYAFGGMSQNNFLVVNY